MNFRLSVLAAAIAAAALSAPLSAQTAKKPASAAASAPKAAVSGKTPIAVVNGSPISTGMADLLVNEQLSQGQQNSPELRSAVREELIKRELLAQEARKKGLDKSDQVTSRVDLARQSILLGLYLDDYLKAHPISDAQVRTEYDRQVALIGDKEYKVRHILLEKEEDAVAVIKKLDAGGKFEELAKDSKDDGTKDLGGDLGWGRAQEYAGNFGNTVPTLEKGRYTKQPVKSNFGYHVLFLEDTRKPEIPDFAAASEKVRQSLIQQAVQKHLAELVSKAKIQ